MTGFARWLSACTALLLALSASTGVGAATVDQGGVPLPQEQVLGIASVTPWVAPEGEFQVRFAPTTAVPVDANLTVTIHQRLRDSSVQGLRDHVLDIIDGANAGRILQTPLTTPMASLGDPATGSTLTIPIRSSRGDRSRVLLPNAGIHPVELVLTAPDGPELWSEVVFLNRLSETDGRAPAQVSLVLPIGSEPAVATDGGPSFSEDDRAQLSSVAALLGGVPEAPLVLAVRPNTLDGLARSSQGWAADLLAQLQGPSNSNSLARLTYVRVDTGGLVASGDVGELQRQIVVGAGTIEDQVQRTPTPGTWVGDESLTTDALSALEDAGVVSVLLPEESLEPLGDTEDGQPITSPVRIEGVGSIRALAFDTDASRRLLDTEVDPAVRAHQAVALMMSGWFATSSRPTPPLLASAILLSPTIDARVVESLGATLRSGGPLGAQPPGAELPVPNDDGPEAKLVPRAVPRTATAIARTNETRRLISAFRSMAGDADPAAQLWDELTNQSVAMTLDSAQRDEMQTAVRQQIDERVRSIDPPRARRILLTSDDSVIPLRFRNDLPYDVRLVMHTRSPRLEIDEPVMEIVLEPGENRVDLEVEVQAPGEFLLRIDLSSPDGGIHLAGPAVPVRSTAISGVGAALSVVSIAFLLGWWIHTTRRARAQDEAPAHSTAPDSLDAGD